MKLYLGCDHAGLELKHAIKNYLETNKINYQDIGCYSTQKTDYPDIAQALAQKVLKNEENKGILICGTGIGVSISANRFPKIYAALCSDTYSAKMARLHNNANILALGARILNKEDTLEILDIWLKTDFEGKRHSLRIQKIDNQ